MIILCAADARDTLRWRKSLLAFLGHFPDAAAASHASVPASASDAPDYALPPLLTLDAARRYYAPQRRRAPSAACVAKTYAPSRADVRKMP